MLLAVGEAVEGGKIKIMYNMNFEYIECETRPWGRFYVIHDEDQYKIKRIEVDINQRLSYQYHNKRSEAWTILHGEGIVVINENDIMCKKGDTIVIPLGAKHRMSNIGNEVLVFIEIQTGSYFGEDDIVRIEDDYNRL